MDIEVRRFEYGTNYTVGRMFVNGLYQCYTLEDTVRPKGVKVFGQTAIPAGQYKVIIDFSEHFQKDLPHILDVPNYEGVRIHPGNTPADTEGCILVGTAWAGSDSISFSRVAFAALFSRLSEAWNDKEEITIKVIDSK